MNSKRTLLAQTICMYMVQLPFYVVLITARIPSVPSEVIGWLMVAGLFANLLMIPVLICSFACGIIHLAKFEPDPLGVTFRTKLILIPWYIMNVLVCIVYVAGFINPFLVLGVPLVVGIEMFVTYVYMLSTGIHAVAYTLKRLFAKKVQVNATIIIAMLFNLVFVLDVLGAYLLKRQLKNVSAD